MHCPTDVVVEIEDDDVRRIGANDGQARRQIRTTPSFVVDRLAYHTWNHSPSKMKNATMHMTTT